MHDFSRRQEIAALCALVLTLVFVVVDQAHDTGLQKGHRGWCSSNVLAIIEHAVPSNRFVGYSLDFVKVDGAHDYQYFDRYPVFFSVAMHVVLHAFELSRASQIYVARQAMNVLHIGTLLFAVALLLELELPLGLAIAATTLAASGKLLVEYRDMVHFDQAALLGFMGLLWAIARWYRVRNDRLVLIAASIAVLMGRGYASFAVLGTWWIAETGRSLLARRTDFTHATLQTAVQVAKQILTSAPTRACVLGIALGASCLVHNILTEAKMNAVPISEVRIVGSARRRLVLDANAPKAKEHSKQLAWGSFSAKMAARELKNLEPFGMPRLLPKKGPGLAVGALLVALVVGFFIASRRPLLRTPTVIAALAGLAWIFPMRGLTAFHEFTTMFLLSLGVVFMAGLLHLVPARFALLPALIGCACLAFSTHARNHQLRAKKASGEVYTQDLQRIEAQLKPGEAVATEPGPRDVVPGVPYALGFFLSEQPLLIAGGGHFLVSTQQNSELVNLTPHNKRVFLYRR